MQIFFFRSKSTADVPLALVELKYLSRLLGKLRINCRKTFCYILMYSTLANSILLGSLAHRTVILDNV